ncbi:hypothetical protein CCUS01_14841 [Colletotrichum cuscutae]|uniref:Uncharacterized protein n=1 Tax=Colletotrichum cuscutae TaxID=1209917 RepID=A0AAI9Y8B6_9PEZI|nr:hypothetical protein CCUS01_14841 [Colletotrichum cuscutae]
MGWDSTLCLTWIDLGCLFCERLFLLTPEESGVYRVPQFRADDTRDKTRHGRGDEHECPKGQDLAVKGNISNYSYGALDERLDEQSRRATCEEGWRIQPYGDTGISCLMRKTFLFFFFCSGAAKPGRATRETTLQGHCQEEARLRFGGDDDGGGGGGGGRGGEKEKQKKRGAGGGGGGGQSGYVNERREKGASIEGVDAKLHVGEVLRVGYPSFGASCPVLAALRSIPVLYLALGPWSLGPLTVTLRRRSRWLTGLAMLTTYYSARLWRRKRAPAPMCVLVHDPSSDLVLVSVLSQSHEKGPLTLQMPPYPLPPSRVHVHAPPFPCPQNPLPFCTHLTGRTIDPSLCYQLRYSSTFDRLRAENQQDWSRYKFPFLMIVVPLQSSRKAIREERNAGGETRELAGAGTATIHLLLLSPNTHPPTTTGDRPNRHSAGADRRCNVSCEQLARAAGSGLAGLAASSFVAAFKKAGGAKTRRMPNPVFLPHPPNFVCSASTSRAASFVQLESIQEPAPVQLKPAILMFFSRHLRCAPFSVHSGIRIPEGLRILICSSRTHLCATPLPPGPHSKSNPALSPAPMPVINLTFSGTLNYLEKQSHPNSPVFPRSVDACLLRSPTVKRRSSRFFGGLLVCRLLNRPGLPPTYLHSHFNACFYSCSFYQKQVLRPRLEERSRDVLNYMSRWQITFIVHLP